MNEQGVETPYGIFPEVMEQARLEEVCVRDGGIQTGPFGSQLHQEDYVTDGTPIITVEHLGDNRIEHQNLPRVSEEDRVRLSRYRLRENDIVFSRVGSVDRRALVRAQEDGWLFSGRCLRIRPDSEKIDSAYLSYFFGLTSFKAHIRSIAVGATMPSINTQILSGITVVFPKSLDEQRAIAKLLACLDEKIEANRRMNDTLEAIARAIFQSWFLDFDPVRAKAGGETPESICQRLGLAPDLLALFPDDFDDAVDGVIPAGWTRSTLGDQAKAHGGFIQTGPFGSQLHASDYVDEGIPVVMPQDMVSRRVSVSKVARVSEDMAQRLSRHALQPGDVVYSRRGDVERHALVSEREAGWLCGTGCLLVRLGPGWKSQAYLSEALDLPATREWLVRHAVGATMPNLNTSILGAVPLMVPPEPLMQAYERIAGPLRCQQIANSRESDSLVETRDALLPKLLSGELRPDESLLGA